MSIKKRLQDIEYQLLKDFETPPTDEVRVKMVNDILRSQLILAEDLSEDLSDTSNMPTTFFGASVAWDVGNPEGDSYTIELNGITVTQDADDPESLVITPNDGINDDEAIALDKES